MADADARSSTIRLDSQAELDRLAERLDPGRNRREAITKTAENRDDGTNDLLMSDVLRTNELQVWFVAEHLVDIPVVRV